MKHSIYRVWRSVVLAAVIIAAAEWAPAEIHPPLSLEWLSNQADFVVVARPTEAKQGQVPTAYTVLEVLKGTGVKAGDAITVSLEKSLISPFLKGGWNQEDKPVAPLVKAVLYLKSPKGGKPGHYNVLYSGLWGVNAKGRVLAPSQLSSLGPMLLTPLAGSTEKQLIQAAKLGVDFKKTAAKLLAITDKKKRAAAILDAFNQTEYQWASRVTYGIQDRRKGAKESLVQRLWESGTHEQCWRLVELWLSHYHPRCGRFATPAGRKFLMEKIQDKKQTRRNRVAAMRLLGENLWIKETPSGSDLKHTGVSLKEQGELIEAFLPMILAKGDLRLEALEIISRLSVSPPRIKPKQINRCALPVVRKLFPVEQDVWAYAYLGELLWELGDEKQWKAIMGAPKGPKVMFAYDLSIFWPGVEYATPPRIWAEVSKEQSSLSIPSLRMERLNKTGKVVETVIQPLKMTEKSEATSSIIQMRLPDLTTLMNLQLWPDRTAPVMQMIFNVEGKPEKLTPGRWRLSLRGPDNAWVSLPRLMMVHKPSGR